MRIATFIVFAVLASSASIASAQEAEFREAWLSASSVDGNKFDYKYTAYDTLGPVQEKPKVLCEYTSYNNYIVLKAVELKVLISAKFDRPDAKVEKAGSINIKSAILECQSRVSPQARLFKVPVQLKIPPVSVPSRD